MTAATTLTPPVRGACKNKSNIFCDGCINMAYCSTECQEKDKNVHKTLCESFKDFQARPGPNFFRAIYFPVNEAKPRFIWLEFEGDHFDMHALEAVKKFLGAPDIYDNMFIGKDVNLNREYDHHIHVYARDDFMGDGSVENASLYDLVGPEDIFRWRGPFLAHGWKYRIGEDESNIDPEDIKETCYDGVCIPRTWTPRPSLPSLRISNSWLGFTSIPDSKALILALPSCRSLSR